MQFSTKHLITNCFSLQTIQPEFTCSKWKYQNNDWNLHLLNIHLLNQKIYRSKDTTTKSQIVSCYQNFTCRNHEYFVSGILIDTGSIITHLISALVIICLLIENNSLHGLCHSAINSFLCMQGSDKNVKNRSNWEE